MVLLAEGTMEIGTYMVRPTEQKATMDNTFNNF